MPGDLWVNEDVNGIRIDAYAIGPPRENEHPDHYNAICLDVDITDRYGHIVQRTTLQLTPYRAKQMIERIHLALDAARTATPRQ